MKNIKIIYGTTGGNTLLVCQKLQTFFLEKKQKTILKNCEDCTKEDLYNNDLLILASPTYGHGLLEPNFQKFFLKIQEEDLKQQKCAVITLGDPKYDIDYFLESGQILSKYIESHNGILITDSLKIAKNPMTYLNSWIEKWGQTIIDKLSE